MTLTKRDQAKVRAALVMVQDAEQDVGEVTRVAQAIINTGTPARQAYEGLFNKFGERVPSLRAPLQRLGQLVEATDDRRIAATMSLSAASSTLQLAGSHCHGAAGHGQQGGANRRRQFADPLGGTAALPASAAGKLSLPIDLQG